MKLLKFIVALLILISIASFSYGETVIPLKALWTPNTEPDMAGYNLYRTDGVRTKINLTGLIPFHPGPGTSNYLFTVTVPDGWAGTMSFVLTAVDTFKNESGDSNTALFDIEPPANPKTFRIQKP